jgi:hypothetical protein
MSSRGLTRRHRALFPGRRFCLFASSEFFSSTHFRRLTIANWSIGATGRKYRLSTGRRNWPCMSNRRIERQKARGLVGGKNAESAIHRDSITKRYASPRPVASGSVSRRRVALDRSGYRYYAIGGTAPRRAECDSDRRSVARRPTFAGVMNGVRDVDSKVAD